MKHTIFLFLVILFLSLDGKSQIPAVDFENLKAPSSPASSIIGIQPSLISKPKSVKDLELALFSNFYADNSISIPNDYGLEIMPYWILNHKNIDELNYINQDKFRSAWSSLSISIASTQQYKVMDTLHTKAVGFGLRTLVYRSPLEQERKILYNKIIKGRRLSIISSVLSTYVLNALQKGMDIKDKSKVVEYLNTDDIKNKINIALSDQSIYYGGITKIEVEEYYAIINSFIKNDKTVINGIGDWKTLFNNAFNLTNQDSVKQELTRYLTNRSGFQVEIAGAASLNFPSNDFEYSRVPQWGVWLTTTYQYKDSKVQFLGMLKYIRNDVDFYQNFKVSDSVKYTNSFDFGGKIVCTPTEKFSADFELLGRYQSRTLEKTYNADIKILKIQEKWNNRWTLNFNYRFNEKMVITYSFGKDFDPIVRLNGNIISTVGMNFGFGGPKTK